MKEAIEMGKLSLPLNYYHQIKHNFGERIAKTTRAMFEASWHHYLLNKSTISLPYWSQRFNNPKAFNLILKQLSKAGWLHCVTLPNRNWSEASLREEKLLEYVSMKQLENIRAFKKYDKYKLDHMSPERDDMTKINGNIRHTGLVRTGFYKSGDTEFAFDTNAIHDNYDVIIAETNKGIDKIKEQWPNMRLDTASYDAISIDVVDSIICHNSTYKSGQFNSDSRGRNIAGMLNKVFNPIGFKVARACLTIPE